MSGSGHPTDSPLKVEKVRIWRLGGRHWEMKWGKSLYDKYIFFEGTKFQKFTVLDVYRMKCKSFYRYDK